MTTRPRIPRSPLAWATARVAAAGARRCGVLLTALGVAVAACARADETDTDFLTPTERWWVESHAGTLTVAPPVWRGTAIEGQDLYAGLIMDYVSLVERKLGVTFRRLPVTSYEDMMKARERGEIDIFSALFETPEYRADWVFTRPYIRIPMIIVMRAALKSTFTPERMPSMRMGVGHGYGIDEFVAENLPGYTVVPVESDRFGLIKASLGELDLMIIDLPSASYYIEKEGLTNLRLAATMGTLYEFSMATRRNAPILREVLDKAIRRITREEREAVYQKWVVFHDEPFYENRQFRLWVKWVGACVSAALVLFLLWTLTLKHQVRAATRELRDAHDRLEERVRERTRELADVNEALHREITERSALAREIITISARERARIGRDLHDSLGQKLVGVTFLTRALGDRLRGRLPDEAKAAERVSGVVEEAIAQARLIVRGLLPMEILDDGLEFALEKLAETTSGGHAVACVFERTGTLAVRDKTLATNLYHIAQEATNNALKHAGASEIVIGLAFDGMRGCLTIRDNGKGFGEIPASGGVGMKIMRYRGELVGGRVAIESAPGAGTTVTCWFQEATSDTEEERDKV